MKIIISALTLVLALVIYWASFRPVPLYTVVYDIYSNYTESDFYLLINQNDVIHTVGHSFPGGDINYVEIRGNLYNYKQPCLISHWVLKNCNISNTIKCPPDKKFILADYNDVYITNDSKEQFDFNSSDSFYLGRAYESIKDTEKALENYKKTNELEKFKKFYSLYRIAVIKMAKDEFLKAYNYHPHRKEPLYYLARMERTAKNYAQCLLYARAGMLVGNPSKREIYVENAIYNYALEEEFALCLHESGNVMEAHFQWERLLKNSNLPDGVKERIEQNFKISKV